MLEIDLIVEQIEEHIKMSVTHTLCKCRFVLSRELFVPVLFSEIADSVEIVGVAEQHYDPVVFPLKGQTAVRIEKFQRRVFGQLGKHDLLFDKLLDFVRFRIYRRKLGICKFAGTHQLAVTLFGI